MEASPGTQQFHTGASHPQPGWLGDARAATPHGDHLAWREADGPHTVPLGGGWTRVGRSLSADVRFDDVTVSRRHALIHRDEGGVSLLDDHSLNGVFVNGERVEWCELHDGDEIAIGRFSIWFLCGAGTAGPGGARHRDRALA